VIAERKLQFPWGAWLKGGEDGSEASEQTGACKGGCSSGHHTHARGADKAGQEGSSGGAEEEEEEDKQTTKDQVGQHVYTQQSSHLLLPCSTAAVLLHPATLQELLQTVGAVGETGHMPAYSEH